MAGNTLAVTLEPLTAGTVPSEVTRLYERAFPAHERLPVEEMLSWGKVSVCWRVTNFADWPS